MTSPVSTRSIDIERQAVFSSFDEDDVDVWKATSTRAEPGKHSKISVDGKKRSAGVGADPVESVDVMFDVIGDDEMIEEIGAHVIPDMKGVGVVGS